MNFLGLFCIWATETVQLLFGTRTLQRSLRQNGGAELALEATFESQVRLFVRRDDVDRVADLHAHFL